MQCLFLKTAFILLMNLVKDGDETWSQGTFFLKMENKRMKVEDKSFGGP